MIAYICSVFVFAFAGLWRVLGVTLGSKPFIRGAVKLFSWAYALSKKQREARLARAVLRFRELGQPQLALADLDVLLAEDGSYAAARLNRALVLQQTGRYREALEDAELYLGSPYADEEYRDVMQRTANQLRALVDES